MGKRIICGCVVLGIVACLIGCQKSDNYELMKESKQQVLPIYEKKDAEVQGEKCALETLQDVYKSDYILEEWKIEKIGEPGGIFCNDEAVLISDKKTDCIFEVDYAGNILKELEVVKVNLYLQVQSLCATKKFMCWIKEIIEYKYWIKNLIILKK